MFTFKPQITRPFSISGVQIHGVLNNFSLARLHNSSLLQQQDFHRQYTTARKFTFVRNPYSRIYSAFCDKILVGAIPSINHHIVSTNNNLTGESVPITSLLNTSFSDTLLYAAGRYTPYVNTHFEPEHSFCHTCSIQYEYIGKMETFDQDIRYILKSTNQSDMLETYANRKKDGYGKDLGAFKEVIWRTFYIVKHEDFYWDKTSCQVKDIIFRCVWKLFKLRGFISDHVHYPVSVDEIFCDFDMKMFEKWTRKAVRKSGSKEELKAQKRKYYLEAFRSVPLSVLKVFRNSVQQTCDMFGYDCSPPDIFHGRKDGDEKISLFTDINYIYQ